MKRVIIIMAMAVLSASAVAAPVWVHSDSVGFHSYNLALDKDGNIFAAASMVVAKFDPSGELLWRKSYAGPGNATLSEWTVDNQGNVYLAGTRTNLEKSDILVMSYGPDGTLRWQQTYDSPAHLADKGVALAVTGNRVVVSASVTVEDWPDEQTWYNDYNIEVMSYTTSGALQWAKQYWTASDELWVENGGDVAVDQAGNAYVLGDVNYWADPSTLGNDPAMRRTVLLKYSPAGELLWEHQFDSLYFDALVQVDGEGSLIVSGYQWVEEGYDIFLFKLLPSGDLLWQTTYDGPGSWESGGCNQDLMRDFAINSANEIYVAGSSCQAAGRWDDDVLLLKYLPDGTLDWVRTYDGPASSHDAALGVAVTPTGNVVMSSILETDRVNSHSIGVVSEFTRAGDVLWCDTLSQFLHGLQVDATGSAVASIGSITLYKFQASCCTGGTGDLNISGRVDLTDLSIMISYLLGSGPVRMCPGKADLNGQDGINLTDLSTLIAYLLAGGVELPACP